MRRVAILPALVTLANAYCGVLAIYKTHDEKFLQAGYLILLAMAFDVLDGLVARLARAQSQFGAYLDSLSDAISFGAAPAFLAKAVVEVNYPWGAADQWGYHPRLLTILTIPFAILAVVRLARYNVEHESGEGNEREGKHVTTFAGIPTPGAAGIVASIVMLAYAEPGFFDARPLLVALPPICFLLGALMVSRVPYEHFGTRFLQGRRDFSYLFVVIIVIGLILFFPEECAFIGFMIYGLSGPVLMPFRKKDAPAPESVTVDLDIPEGL
ncbi:MAG: CDP-alcohol phosphatidyltransferase family protein [Planctomycetota bacterium]|jgi:CDP-diacylglycerol--serine O-phosphatidyltransferase